MMFIFIVLQVLFFAMPITCKIIQISSNYERFTVPSSYIVNVPATSNLVKVPAVSSDFVNVPPPGTPRVCQDQLVGLPNNIQWAPYVNIKDKMISNEVNNFVKTTLPYDNEFRRKSRKGLGSTLENIKTQLANIAQFALASYNLVENADVTKRLVNRY